MDPAAVGVIAHNLVPVVAVVVTFGMPVAIVYIIKHFKLKNRELELEAELHSKDLELRLRTIEARQAAVEAALGAIGGRPIGSLQDRASLLEPPAASAEPAEAPADPQRVRSR